MRNTIGFFPVLSTRRAIGSQSRAVWGRASRNRNSSLGALMPIRDVRADRIPKETACTPIHSLFRYDRCVRHHHGMGKNAWSIPAIAPNWDVPFNPGVIFVDSLGAVTCVARIAKVQNQKGSIGAIKDEKCRVTSSRIRNDFVYVTQHRS